MEGMAVFALRIDNRGLWSVTMIKERPNKYLWNFFTPRQVLKLLSLFAHNFFSALLRVHDANAMGHSSLSIMCDSTAPSPYWEALHDSLSGFSVS